VEYVIAALAAYYNRSKTEHQLFEVTERSIFIDFSSKYLSNASLDLFSNVLFSLQALWQARWYLLLGWRRNEEEG
jgi:hypothetical protein